MEGNHSKRKRNYNFTDPSCTLPLKKFCDNRKTLNTAVLGLLGIDVVEPETIKYLHENGCFGVGSASRSTPAVLRANRNDVPLILQRCYERREKWSHTVKQTMLRGEPPTKIRVVPDTIDLSECTKQQRAQLELENNVQYNPFPIIETLVLLPEEALFLQNDLACLRIIELDGRELSAVELLQKFCQQNDRFVERFIAYRYFRTKNWIIKSGIKFGGDFLLYQKGPRFNHAKFLVWAQRNDESSSGHIDVMNSNTLQGLNRICETSGKDLLIVDIHFPDNISLSRPDHLLDSIPLFRVTECLPKRFIFGKQRENLN